MPTVSKHVACKRKQQQADESVVFASQTLCVRLDCVFTTTEVTFTDIGFTKAATAWCRL